MNIDWSTRKVLVVESDDWGICSWAPDPETFEEVRKLDVVQEYWQKLAGWVGGTLESPADMERLFGFLERYRGRDGRSPNFVACYVVANPDYDRILASDLQEYHDIFLDEGVPSRWERGDLLAKAKEGMKRGVWLPEFHARLHHAQPHKWLQAVRDGSPQAAAIFQYQMFQCEERRPEYEDMSPQQQAEWIVPAIRRMDKLFGRLPKCGVNSDAMPETEQIWAGEGLHVRMCRGNLPNNRSAASHHETLMGAYQRPDLDMTYLSRNCFLEPLGSGDLDHPSGAIAAAEAAVNDWSRGVPAVCSSHRKNYLSMIDGETQNGYDQAEWFFDKLTSGHPDLYFLTSWEVAQMYRRGASIELFGDHAIVRNWTDAETSVSEQLPEGVEPGALHVLTGGRLPAIEFDGGAMTAFVAPGDYLIELDGWE